MEEYLSFEEVAAELKCSLRKVHQIVLEDKRLLAQRITLNGMILESCGPDGVCAYDLDFCHHVSDEGKITCDVYESQPDGKTVVTRVLEVGYLRIARGELARFISSGVVPGLDSTDLLIKDELNKAEKPPDGVESAKAEPVDQSPAHEPQTAEAGPRFSMTKAALISSHEHEWPSIRVDIAGAANNGLKAAKAGSRGWYEDIAMDWARAKGKLNTPVKPANELTAVFHSMASVPSRKHILQG